MCHYRRLRELAKERGRALARLVRSRASDCDDRVHSPLHALSAAFCIAANLFSPGQDTIKVDGQIGPNKERSCDSLCVLTHYLSVDRKDRASERASRRAIGDAVSSCLMTLSQPENAAAVTIRINGSAAHFARGASGRHIQCV